MHASSPSCRMPHNRHMRVMVHWLAEPKYSTRVKSGSVTRTTSPSLIFGGGFASVGPPERLRTVLRSPALVTAFAKTCALDIVNLKSKIRTHLFSG